MTMRFALSLTGLTAHEHALDVIGNNVANNGTVGFKSSKARFADIFQAFASKGGPLENGAKNPINSPQLTQGSVTGSDNPMDVAILGTGFLRMVRDGEVTYTRDGQFRLGTNNTSTLRSIEDRGHRQLTGYLASYSRDPDGIIQATGTPVPLVIDTVMPAARTSEVAATVNLDSRQDVPRQSPFDAGNPASYSHTHSVTVYDRNGGSHALNLFYVKTATPQTWQLYTNVDGLSQTGPESVVFAGNGQLDAAATRIASHSYTLAGGVSLTGVQIDLTGTTQYGVPFSVQAATQNGYAEGNANSEDAFTIEPDGVIWGHYSNGQARRVGQLVLANFVNANALLPAGDGQWVENGDPAMGTGRVLIGVPGDRPDQRGVRNGGLGYIKGGALELSNVDLNVELVALIEQQRNYQANAQTFKIMDQTLQALSQIR